MKRKIAFLGAGSRYFEFVLAELAVTPELAGCKVVMYDTNRKRMNPIRQVGKRILAKTKTDLRLTATTDLARALDGADYSVSSIGWRGFASAHLQCVGRAVGGQRRRNVGIAEHDVDAGARDVVVVLAFVALGAVAGARAVQRRLGYSPVMNDARLGQQWAVGVCRWVNSTPSSASRVALGVMHG